MESPLAVIDLGSNSARIAVLRLDPSGQLDIIADARTSLQLARHIDSRGRLEASAVTEAVAAVRDFRAVAAAAGAERTVAVATAAIRTATNRDSVLARLEADTGLVIRIIDGEEEARFAFLGAVHGLPIDTGYLIDVGGGSFELAYFERRRALRWWTFELGSLVTTDRFLRSDPPRPSEIGDLRDHVIQTLRDAGVPVLPEDGGMVGTGGTVRNLAKIHMRSVAHPIARVDGYLLQRREVRDLTSRLTTRNRSSLRTVPGLSTDRADSITGGALVVIAAMEALGARSLMVSGHGLREGIALAELNLPLPEVWQVRRGSVAALASRFSTWDERRAARRVEMVRAILGVADPTMTAEMREVLDHATTLLDVGQSVNYYDRWSHAAGVTASADLQGFTHREVALIATTLARLGKARSNLPRYARLCTRDDIKRIDRLAVIIELADELDRRVDGGGPPSFRYDDRRNRVVVSTGLPYIWEPEDLTRRFRTRLGRTLSLRPAESAGDRARGAESPNGRSTGRGPRRA
ncbi:MAG TPA: Ppx/GppA phosphatase family protein [Candidatus Saccharimonadales bacterium]|nr:Ppx/GppA phosphatase family protein [Candidatus Saccharimonadales bacterium]